MKDIIKKFGFLAILLVTACDLDGDLENPNQITPSNADVNLIMNGVQVSFANFYNAAQSAVNPLVRMEAMTRGFRHQRANTAEGVDGLWSNGYEHVIVNADLVIQIAEPDRIFFRNFNYITSFTIGNKAFAASAEYSYSFHRIVSGTIVHRSFYFIQLST